MIFLVALTVCAFEWAVAVNGPVVGVMTQPTESNRALAGVYEGRSYLAASYVVSVV